jgi:hypothetical protein
MRLVLQLRVDECNSVENGEYTPTCAQRRYFLVCAVKVGGGGKKGSAMSAIVMMGVSEAMNVTATNPPRP